MWEALLGKSMDEREFAPMTVELEKTECGLAETAATEQAPAYVSRRMLLRGAAVSVPTVLTLHSGAAFAFSSNLIGAAAGAPKDPNGNYLCLDVSSTAGPGPRGGVYDLGAPAYADVAAIPSNREYHTEKKSGSPKVTGPQMCSSGGDFYYKKYGATWKPVNVKRGVLVSATALSSFSGSNINVKVI